MRDGRLQAPRGVVSAASYAARKFGVHSAMPLVKAHRLLPAGDLHPWTLQSICRDVPAHQGDFFIDSLRQYRWPPSMKAYIDLTGTERLLGSAYSAARICTRRSRARPDSPVPSACPRLAWSPRSQVTKRSRTACSSFRPVRRPRFSHPYQCDAFRESARLASPRWPVRESGPCARQQPPDVTVSPKSSAKTAPRCSTNPKDTMPRLVCHSHRGGLRTQVRVP